MRRTVFNEDHEAFRETIRAFIAAEVVPVYDEWFAAGQVPREFYLKLGELGIFGIEVDEEYGGAGIDSHKYEAVIYEETARAGVSFGGSGVHTLLGLPYVKMLATDEQKKRWLPKFATGEEMWALAMTEPGTGSDVAGMKTTAKLSEDGTHYVLNGSKTFITGELAADPCCSSACPYVSLLSSVSSPMGGAAGRSGTWSGPAWTTRCRSTGPSGRTSGC
ncbi:Acyl-[acyl-carrier-protein] dehydrogenase MbtN OS=Streptomyces microflavus OX=1919 GN=Smic_26190 PE=3 SV=1 [Streptomyces microflavus]